MVSVLVVFVVLALCGGLARSFPGRVEVEERPQRRHFRRGVSSGSVDEVYDSYYSISNKNEENEELNVVSRVQRLDLNKIKYSQIYDIDGETYILLKSSRHRNKRYTSYLTLCPFKICNMGRKRVRSKRYIQEIRPGRDNEAT